jgi:hypothetical protein
MTSAVQIGPLLENGDEGFIDNIAELTGCVVDHPDLVGVSGCADGSRERPRDFAGGIRLASSRYLRF